MFKTLGAAVAGGAAAHWAGLPLAWMLGAMWAAALLAAAGRASQPPRRMRHVALAAVGCYLGAGAGPHVQSVFSEGAMAAFAAVAVLTAASTAGAALLARRLTGADAGTSTLAAIPGGLSLLFALADDYGGDRRIIGALQVVRIIAVASIIPLWAQFGGGGSETPPVAPETSAGLTPESAAAFAAAFAAGLLAGAALRSSQAFLLASMFAAGALYALGAEGAPPLWILYAGQIVLGAAAGARFDAGGRSLRLVAIATLVAAFHLLAAALAAAALAAFTGAPFFVMLLALAPGGIAEICLTAELLDLNPAFVAAAQLERLAIIVVLSPIVMRRLARQSQQSRLRSSRSP